MTLPLAIVTATTHVNRARSCVESWINHAVGIELIPLFVIHNGPEPVHRELGLPGTVIWLHREEYLGSVPAFRIGVDAAIAAGAEVIACLHDDFEILEDGWDQKVIRAFRRNPSMGLAGFGGAISLGHEDMYRKPYDPMSLARGGFRSNLVDAEVHGVRSLLSEPVACLDGFSQIGRRQFFDGLDRLHHTNANYVYDPAKRPWQVLEDLGIVHHLYDSLLGALAARLGWETWYLPLRAQHHGGRTAVGDAGYGDWAKTQIEGGDHGFWQKAHQIGYEAFQDVLPLRV